MSCASGPAMGSAELRRTIARRMAQVRRRYDNGELSRAELLTWYARILREFSPAENSRN